MIGVEPFGLVLAEKVGGAVLEVIAKNLMERARAVRQRGTTADKAAEYALIARDTAFALQAEFNRILGEAEWCDVNKEENVRVLGLRIHHYLRVDALRPVLKEAVSGFAACVERLSAENYGTLVAWFGRGADRDVALAKCKNVVNELRNTVDSLATAFPNDMVSGVGALFLVDIEKFLKKCIDGAAKMAGSKIDTTDLVNIIEMARQQTTVGPHTFPGLAITEKLDRLLELYS